MACKCKAGVLNRGYKRGESHYNYTRECVLDQSRDDGVSQIWKNCALGSKKMGGSTRKMGRRIMERRRRKVGDEIVQTEDDKNIGSLVKVNGW